ncbi:MAG: catalase-related domain-containing protein [Lentihominibacter sp.]
MKEYIQAGNFYRSLEDREKNDLADAIAADIFFLDDSLQQKVLDLLHMVDPELKQKIEDINDFTL